MVSGGHTHIIDVEDYTRFHVIGRTRDDAAGESFDKVARSIGFAYPGGVNMDKVSGQGNIHAYQFPHPKVEGSEFDLSFSGLKTYVINLVHNAAQRGEEICREDLAASFGYTVASILCEKLFLAQQHTHRKTIVVAGGVSANSQLRAMLTAEAKAALRAAFRCADVTDPGLGLLRVPGRQYRGQLPQCHGDHVH